MNLETLEKRIALLEEIVRRGIDSQSWPTDVIWPQDSPPFRTPRKPPLRARDSQENDDE